MKPTRLIQRLKPVYRAGADPGRYAVAFNKMAFGGRPGGGLSEEALQVLSTVFQFDYMGDSEFEWGAVPEALWQIARHVGEYRSWSLSIPLAQVDASLGRRDEKFPEGSGVVYVFAREADRAEVERRIALVAARKTERGAVDLQESACLSAALRPAEDWTTDVCGWLELDNGFFFFTDREMHERVVALFGVSE